MVNPVCAVAFAVAAVAYLAAMVCLGHSAGVRARTRNTPR